MRVTGIILLMLIVSTSYAGQPSAWRQIHTGHIDGLTAIDMANLRREGNTAGYWRNFHFFRTYSTPDSIPFNRMAVYDEVDCSRKISQILAMIGYADAIKFFSKVPDPKHPPFHKSYFSLDPKDREITFVCEEGTRKIKSSEFMPDRLAIPHLEVRSEVVSSLSMYHRRHRLHGLNRR